MTWIDNHHPCIGTSFATLLSYVQKIGIEHIGITTGGRGGMTFVSGYNDVRNLSQLAEVLTVAGFTREEVGPSRAKMFIVS